MASYMHTEHYRLNEPVRPSYTHSEFKTEPFDFEPARQSFQYSTQHPYSEEELAESLGWVEYPTNTQQNMISTHRMHLSSEMAKQHNTIPQATVTMPLSGSLASNGTYSSVSIRQAGQSPSGWHSSLESPSLLPDGQNGHACDLGSVNMTESESNRGNDLVIAAEKKAMRRYSHNAVERRRRDNINEQIHELSMLVNELNSVYAPRPESVVTTSSNNIKPNKGMVLRRSVEYIRMLRDMVEAKSNREQLLEEEIIRLGGTIPSRSVQDAAVSMWIDESAIAEDDD